MKTEHVALTNKVIELLKQLIEIPSLSGEENKTASHIADFLKKEGIESKRKLNNVWAYNRNYDSAKKTILLNSHHDTVKPNSGWTYDPFKATVENGKLIGLGSCDAGASLVSLLAAFFYFYNQKNLKYNLIFSATAEEETTGENSIRAVLPDLEPFDFAIVGEPTGMEMAIAEKGLIVLNCQANGVSGHAARGNGINAITKAIEDINWFTNYSFPKESKVLGPVRMSVTGINGGIQHNVIPDKCTFLVDIRSTDAYTNSEILEIIKKNISSDIVRASDNLNPTSVPENHILVETAKKLNVPRFASPTMSDQAQINKPSVKMGAGLSERSHTADEFVYLSEIEDGVEKYIHLLEKIL
ncbi:MAG: M20/M25/M40 family metallo-hydrolase [Calditrichaeota bacterium]|nr:MAG: M20/M25/M40 family metallo-hydrolase [Calditrichota bacterium]MBL1205726.1 M20/M25/M40 family metallo-hydrolase [Calditrichota bacterium]NOG45554.1 M20 family metallo-hydrolase [Calditrichota bacterium]